MERLVPLFSRRARDPSGASAAAPAGPCASWQRPFAGGSRDSSVGGRLAFGPAAPFRRIRAGAAPRLPCGARSLVGLVEGGPLVAPVAQRWWDARSAESGLSASSRPAGR